MQTLVAVSALMTEATTIYYAEQGGAYPGTLHLPGDCIEPGEDPPK